MNEIRLASMISCRKSVRAYASEPLLPTTLEEVLFFAEHSVPLFPDVKVSFRILDRAEVCCACSLSAPHYLAAYSERSPDADLNCGFMLQQVDLWLSSRGIGSCWLGMTIPKERTFQGLPYVVLLSFGNPAEPVHRTSSEQFHRKNLPEISAPGVIPDYIESMRLAPSAMNKQPWFFSGDTHSCHAFSARGKGFLNLAENWRFVDLGIVLSHLYLAALADEKNVSFRREDSIPAGNGSEYILSCRITDESSSN